MVRHAAAEALCYNIADKHSVALLEESSYGEFLGKSFEYLFKQAPVMQLGSMWHLLNIENEDGRTYMRSNVLCCKGMRLVGAKPNCDCHFNLKKKSCSSLKLVLRIPIIYKLLPRHINCIYNLLGADGYQIWLTCENIFQLEVTDSGFISLAFKLNLFVAGSILS